MMKVGLVLVSLNLFLKAMVNMTRKKRSKISLLWESV
jgi:hypothetical protein